MRIRTHGVATAAALALMSACASAPAQSAETTTSNAELKVLRTQQVEQTRRIAELEARLSLLEVDARRARDDSGSNARVGESVRIGGAATELTSHVAAPQEAVRTEPEDEGKRPSLRLYGHSSGGSTQRASLPPVPVVNERLPVVPLPEQRAAKSVRGAGASMPSAEGATEPYRRGLRSLQERRYDDALAQFAAFINDQPRHELVASALYWRGEALYAKRDYNAASRELETLLERYPSTSRAPDALLKLGLSYRKLGASERADQALLRLRTDFPTSQAAAVAAREGST